MMASSSSIVVEENIPFPQAQQLMELAWKNTHLYTEMLLRGGKPAWYKGSTTPDVLFLGEAPGCQEDKQGIPFVGRSGSILDIWSCLCAPEEVGVMNAVPILPMHNGLPRTPALSEIAYFVPYVHQAIRALDPQVIICVGRCANYALTERRLSVASWTSIEISGKTYWVGFVYHPAYYLRNGRTGEQDFVRLLNGRGKLTK